MKRNIIIGFGFSIVLLLSTAALYRGQEPPAPPAAPAPEAMPAPAAAPAPWALVAPQAEEFNFDDKGAWLGVSIQDLTTEKARELKLSSGEYGVLVERVEEDSPAARAGLEKGDVVLEFAGERVRSAAQLRRLIRETPPGRTVTLQISRNGQTQTLNAKLKTHQRAFFFQDLPKIAAGPFAEKDFDYKILMPGPRLGISGEDLPPQLASYFGVKQGKGVLVREVEAGSAAEKAGLKAGDVITRVEDTAVSSPDGLRRALPRDFEGTKKVHLTIVRDRHEQSLSVELEAPDAPMHSLEREITRAREQQLEQMSAEIALHKADLQKAVGQATRQWTRERQRYLEETRKSMELLRRQLQEQKLHEIRAKQPRSEEI